MPCILAGDASCVKTGGCLGQPPLVTAVIKGLCFASMPGRRGGWELRIVMRKLGAIAALLALLLPGVSVFADTFSAADLPACCNTVYCPLHHRQMSDLQRDKSNCDATGVPGHKDCSMRACDAAPNPIVGTAAFILAIPVALRGPAMAEAAPAPAPQFFPYVATVPVAPPPRTFLS
jgi:hypothetical protein